MANGTPNSMQHLLDKGVDRYRSTNTERHGDYLPDQRSNDNHPRKPTVWLSFFRIDEASSPEVIRIRIRQYNPAQGNKGVPHDICYELAAARRHYQYVCR